MREETDECLHTGSQMKKVWQIEQDLLSSGERRHLSVAIA